MRESIIVPGEPLVLGQGFYKTRSGVTVYLLKNINQWLDNLPWCVHRVNSDFNTGNPRAVKQYPSYTCNDDGRVFPVTNTEVSFDIVERL